MTKSYRMKMLRHAIHEVRRECEIPESEGARTLYLTHQYEEVLHAVANAQAYLVSHLEGHLPMSGVMALGELQRAERALAEHLKKEGILL